MMMLNDNHVMRCYLFTAYEETCAAELLLRTEVRTGDRLEIKFQAGAMELQLNFVFVCVCVGGGQECYVGFQFFNILNFRNLIKF
jgi:hypothetical protein